MTTHIAKVIGDWGFVGCERKDTIEFEMEDSATPEQIENKAQELCWEWFCNYADCSAYEIETINAPASDKADE